MKGRAKNGKIEKISCRKREATASLSLLHDIKWVVTKEPLTFVKAKYLKKDRTKKQKMRQYSEN